ncbi:MAG: SCP2 sterol-binding domain-containing protein [Promethearchaeota archaeon]
MNEEIKQKIIEKIKNNSLQIEDIEDFLRLIADISNSDEDIQEELENFNCVYQFNIQDGPAYWLKIENGKLTTDKGYLEDAEVVLTMGKETALKLFAGEMDPTKEYLDGNLKITGPIPNAIKLRVILEMIREIIVSED